MDIIPLPDTMEYRPGSFRFNPGTRILTDSDNLRNAEYLHALLSLPMGFQLPIAKFEQPGQNSICLLLNQELGSLGREGYQFSISPQGITIEAPAPAGVFYGVQSLRQLLPAELETRNLVAGLDWQVPCLVITDKPRFPWRGFMLDEGRHFQGRQMVLRTLDLMALQKLNIFHWHLTEDQGWRIEIKKYPRLAEFASQRAGTRRGFTAGRHDGIPHGGFYSQEEIREIVAYAAERQITIVPEVEMPGHARAALAAYPELSCTGGPFDVATHFGIFEDVFCAGKETVFEFLENVLDEVLELFPSPFIHIGGDETPRKRWNACPDCQRRIRAEGLKDAHALQVYFTNRIAAFLESRGRHAIGWNEILQPGLVEGAVVQFWKGSRRQISKAVAAQHRRIVMSPLFYYYLDYPYLLIPLHKVYNYDPVPSEMDEQTDEAILGVESPLWTERVPDTTRHGYQVYPRLTAAAETGWTAREKKNLPDFRRRLEPFFARLDILGTPHASLNDVDPLQRKR